MSLEIAELTGKQHFHVMEAIRKMEPAWEKVTQSKFGLRRKAGRFDSLLRTEEARRECLFKLYEKMTATKK